MVIGVADVMGVMVIGVISHTRNRSALVEDERELQERTDAG